MTSIQPDQWLGGLLGKPTFRIHGEPLGVAAEDLPGGPAFIYARVDAADFQALGHLQRLSFVVIDCNLILQLPSDSGWLRVEDAPLSTSIRFADSEDEAEVRELAKQAFEFDRFHRDPHISDEVANRIKEEWAGNFFAGLRGSHMVVSADDRGINGFLQLLSVDNSSVAIDLIAVSARCRRKGVAQSMIRFVLQHCVGDRHRLEVGTQVGNRNSLLLYEASGFRTKSATYVLHRHIGET